MSARLVATATATGVVVMDAALRNELMRPPTAEFWETYCGICGRCTDHTGEHDDVEGVRETYRTEKWVAPDGTLVTSHYVEVWGPIDLSLI